MDFVDRQQVSGNVFTLPRPLEEHTTYYVSVIPYNEGGEAEGCTEISFRTQGGADIGKTQYGFSPNGDGIRDFWEIEGIENYPENSVSVFNRWGDLVFQVEGYDNRSRVFTGEANKLTGLGGGRLPSGTYFFRIHTGHGNSNREVKGFLVLKR